MDNVEAIIQWLQSLSPLGVYAMLFVVCYVENIFPPSPSDVLMLFIATLIGVGTISLVPAVAVATLGSVAGFLTAFWLGRKYGARIVKSPYLPFLHERHLHRVDNLFLKYGFGVIVANRFLAGTRAVVSFTAGMSKMNAVKTTLYCTVSALVWNTAIILLGSWLGENWREGEKILSRYGAVISLLIGIGITYAVVRWFMNRKKRAEEEADASSQSVATPDENASDKTESNNAHTHN